MHIKDVTVTIHILLKKKKKDLTSSQPELKMNELEGFVYKHINWALVLPKGCKWRKWNSYCFCRKCLRAYP